MSVRASAPLSVERSASKVLTVDSVSHEYFLDGANGTESRFHALDNISFVVERGDEGVEFGALGGEVGEDAGEHLGGVGHLASVARARERIKPA